jgi:modulator of FtsH protease HflK
MRSQFDDDGNRPDVADVVAQVSDVFQRNLRRFFPIVVGMALAGLLYMGVYSVGPGSQGVVRTFGRETGKTSPGLHFAIPFVQKVDVVSVEQIRRIEIGRGDDKRAEARMITGDANIAEATMIVQYRVADPSKYLFRLRDSEETLRATAEVALRSVIGRTSIDDVITTGREKVQEETRAWLQKLMDEYQSGLTVTEVKLQAVDAPEAVRDAFHDVVRAREEREKLINEAKGYQADVIPKARGEARKIEREAEAYKEQRILRANGDAAKFNSMLAEYAKAQRVTRDRMYLETMERILSKVEKKVIVDKDVAKGALPLLPLGGVAAGAAASGAK